MKKKGVTPILVTLLLLLVTVLSAISLHNWYSSTQNSDLNNLENIPAFTKVTFESFLNNEIYFKTEKELLINKIEIEDIVCDNISGTYVGYFKINISHCLKHIHTDAPKILIFTDLGIVAKSFFTYSKKFNCYDPFFIGTIGIEEPCLDLLIVDRLMLLNAIDSGSDKYIVFNEENYTFGDSQYSIFTGQITNLNTLFDSSISFNSDINYWDVHNVTSMNNMFEGATSFNQSLDNWNVSSLTSMSFMFRGATSFNQPLDSWNVSSVTNMNFMFYEAGLFNQPLDSWDVSSVESMTGMFYDATSFNQPLNSWDVSSVESMSSMFYNAGVFNQPLNSWNVSSVTSMIYMFFDANVFNQSLNNWDVSSVETTRAMFFDANAFNQPLNNWDVSSVTNMGFMFWSVDTFNQNLTMWNVSQVSVCEDFVSLGTPFLEVNRPTFLVVC